MSDEDRDTAGVIAPPPLIFALPFIAGLVANWMRPLPILEGRAGLFAGLALLTIGAGLIGMGIVEFRRASTAVVPYSPTTAIVSSGPFSFTRNPLYLGMALIYTGIALGVNSWWPLLLLPIAVVVVKRGVIDREEKYLERKFGAVYLEYKARVRRWI